jgi:hypothetical protein
MGTEDISPGIKGQEGESDHSPPSSVEAKNGGAILPRPYTSSWHGAEVIKHKDNFNFIP